MRESSPDDSSGSEAVADFTKKILNIPMSRRETMRQAYRQTGHQDSGGSLGGEQKARNMGYQNIPQLEIDGTSPPRSPNNSSLDAGGQLLLGSSGHAGNAHSSRRPSSPQAIPGLPLIEIRRPSALSQFEFGYFVNSPEMLATDSDCAPLLLSGGNGIKSSRKSSDGRFC